MPNHGRSGGCRTCKRRRVKCDEGRPACSPCQRLSLDCGGYSRDFFFRNQNDKLGVHRPRNTTVRRPVKAVAEPGRSLLTGIDVAVPFFLVHCAGLGRSLVAARGFFETLIPAYETQSQDSALSLAVVAIAAKVFSLWRHDDVRFHAAPYAEAAAAVRTAIRNPEERRRPTTALAILAMHLFENIAAIYESRSPTHVHHHGALSLLPIAVLDHHDALISAYVQGFVFHLEVSSALRQRRPVKSNVLACMTTTGSSIVNISSALDLIGVSVAQLQADYKHAMELHQPSSLCDCVLEAKRIDRLLQEWAASTPDHLRPLRLVGKQDFSHSIPAFENACEVYPSCQLATIWSLWRIQRILLIKIRIECGRSVGSDVPMISTAGIAVHVDLVQELVDGVCYSVPFYLGNRTNPSSLADFGDQDIFFPSYHSLARGRAKVAAPHQGEDGITMLEDDHHRHVIANGAWHAMSPLSSLLTLFSDGVGGRAVASCLKSGQHEWIREQFMRVARLLHLPVEPLLTSERGKRWPMAGSQRHAADHLAERVRRGAMFMSGP